MQGHFFGNFLDKSYDNGYGNKIAIIQGIPFIIAWYDTKTILDALDINIVDKSFKIIFFSKIQTTISMRRMNDFHANNR